MSEERCSCSDPWNSHSGGFIWDRTRPGTTAHLVTTVKTCRGCGHSLHPDDTHCASCGRLTSEGRWARDLRYFRLTGHLKTTHGRQVPSGTKNRRLKSEALHEELHAEGCGHSIEEGLQ